MIKGVIFLLIKFGNLEWMDMPYNVVLGPLDPLQKIENDNEGYAMTIILADTYTGKIEALILHGMSNKTSKEFYKLIEEQKRINQTINEYNQNLNAVYQSYSTKDLLKFSK